MDFSRITIFAGHYGSGKTTVAVNYALMLKKAGLDVSICDIDIVNPYYRVHDFKAILEAGGVGVISPEFANTNLDIPVIPASIRSVFDMPERRFVIDLGGDERGALALGQYGDLLNKEKSLEMLMVVNPYRPMSADVGGLREIKEEIEAACGVKFTGIVNNSNLGRETVFDDVEAVRNVVDAASDELGLPVKMTAIKRELYDEMAVKLEGRLPEMFSLDIFFPWENTIIGRTPDKTPI